MPLGVAAAQAGQDARKNIAATFALVLPDGMIGGYYTLSSTAVKLAELPIEVSRLLPRFPLIPATLLGRLAVDKRLQGKGHGRFLFADALLRAVRSAVDQGPDVGATRSAVDRTAAWIAMQWRTRLACEATNCSSGVSVA